MAASQKSGKKRAAPTQSGSKAKKPHLESSKFDKKRSRPITQPIAQDIGSDSDRSDEEHIGSDGDEFMDGSEALEEDEQAMPVDPKPEQYPKDPNCVYWILSPRSYNLISPPISCS